jgi:hypothetical protein
MKIREEYGFCCLIGAVLFEARVMAMQQLH